MSSPQTPEEAVLWAADTFKKMIDELRRLRLENENLKSRLALVESKL